MSTRSPELAAIEAAARDYIQGWYTGDVARMDRALDADLVKRIQASDEPGAFRQVSKARMLEMTAGGGGEMPEAEFEVEVYDVSEDIASARSVSPEYIDYLHFAKTPDGWKIVNVLFRTLD